MALKQKATRRMRQVLLGSAALSLLVGMPLLVAPHGAGVAYAQGSGQGGQGGGGQGGGGQGGGGQRGGSGMGQGGGGSGTTHGSGSGTTQGVGGSSGMGQGGQGGSGVERGHYGQSGSTGEETGDETDSDKKGPQFGGGTNTRKPVPGTTGGRPVWAKEGIPEVELGRLSVARAPAHVIDKALAEAVSNWTTMSTTVLTLTAEGQPTLTMTVAQLYSLPADKFAQIVQTYYDSIVRIDSPLENLGLLKNLASTGTTSLTGVTPASTADLAAIFLGSASDKTIPITNDTVTAIYTILGLPTLTAEQTATIAADAEAVRLAILSGHG